MNDINSVLKYGTELDLRFRTRSRFSTDTTMKYTFWNLDELNVSIRLVDSEDVTPQEWAEECLEERGGRGEQEIG